MTDTSESPEHEDEPDEDEEYSDKLLYVEKNTRLIFEVQFFPEFALVRPASPLLYRYIRRLSLVEFSGCFDEFDGDHQSVFDFLNNGGNVEIEVL